MQRRQSIFLALKERLKVRCHWQWRYSSCVSVQTVRLAKITEEISARQQTLKTIDFADIVDQIVAVFPSKNWRDVYYRPRSLTQKHPAGKLYWKYANLMSKLLKRRRSGQLQESVPVS
nr:uncharacterized protein LOC118879536 [Drosophila suzukii]